jgi:ABC-type transport system substrate-binding protein
MPEVDEVEVEIVEESQPRWLSFLNGSYHWLAVPGDYVRLAAPGGELAPFLKKKGVRLQRSLQPMITMSFFFMEHPLVGGYTPEKVALRRAIGLAFDGQRYIDQVWGGQMVLAQSTIAPFTSGFETDYRSEMSSFDPARAQALLDLHGYVDRNGDGWREQPDGAPLELVMASMGSQRDRLSSELWKRSMDRIGVKMRFDVSTWPELLKKSRAGTLMMWGYSWSASSPDGGFFLGIAYGPNASESNDPRFKLDAFDRLYGFTEHEAVCGSRTAPCAACGRVIVMKMHAAHHALLPCLISRVRHIMPTCLHLKQTRYSRHHNAVLCDDL